MHEIENLGEKIQRGDDLSGVLEHNGLIFSGGVVAQMYSFILDCCQTAESKALRIQILLNTFMCSLHVYHCSCYVQVKDDSSHLTLYR